MHCIVHIPVASDAVNPFRRPRDHAANRYPDVDNLNGGFTLLQSEVPSLPTV
jgi:hypothetical protein